MDGEDKYYRSGHKDVDQALELLEEEGFVIARAIRPEPFTVVVLFNTAALEGAVVVFSNAGYPAFSSEGRQVDGPEFIRGHASAEESPERVPLSSYVEARLAVKKGGSGPSIKPF